MTREQAKQMLITLGIEAPTEDQITNYLNSVNGEVQKEKVKVDANKAELERLKAVEEELEIEKNKNLSAEEKLQAELEKAQQAQKDFAKKNNRLEVETLFVKAGLTSDDYGDYIDDLVSDNAELSLKLANGFVATINKARESATQKAKEDLLDGTLKPDGDGGDGDDEPEKTGAEKIAETLGKTAGEAVKVTEKVLSNYL